MRKLYIHLNKQTNNLQNETNLFTKKTNKQTIMKKITFMLLASATIFLASCTSGSEKTETTSTDSTAVVVDSTACDSTCVAVDTTTVVM